VALDSSDRYQFELDVDWLRVGDVWRRCRGRLLVVGQFRRIARSSDDVDSRPGDRLSVCGQLSQLESIRNPGQFDYSKLLRSRGIRCLLRLPNTATVRVLKRARWNAATMARLRLRWCGCFARRLSRRSAGLAAAILLGERSELSLSRRDAFTRTGTGHLLAISGLHVGILAATLLWFTRAGWISFGWGVPLVMLLTTGYAGLTEVRSPVVRATVLVLLVGLSWLTGRRLQLANTLSCAALIVLVVAPDSLFDVGAQFSFLAVAALGRLATADRLEVDSLTRLVRRTRPWYVRAAHHVFDRGRRTLAAGACVWLVTLPLTMLHFNQVTPLAIPLNLLTWVPLSLSLITGWLLLVSDELHLPGGAVWAWVCDMSLTVLEAFVQHATKFPLACWRTVTPQWQAVGVCYLLIAWAWVSPIRLRRYYYSMAAVCVVWGWWQPQLARRLDNDVLRCAFLSVGHGGCVVLELPDGSVWLYDAGSLGNLRSGVDNVSRYLWGRGIKRIDRAVISHVDADHYAFVPELAKRFAIPEVTLSCHCGPGSEAAMSALVNDIRGLGTSVTLDGSPHLISEHDCELEILHPRFDCREPTDNANSLVIRCRYAGASLLLSGDLEPPGLQRLTTLGACQVDVALVPHHGSLSSSPADFVAWCNPALLVISDGDSTSLSAYQEAIGPSRATCLHTGIHGAVIVELRPGRVQVLTPCAAPFTQ
ncbi:MAG: ComEC/Rec2 family competence protein, partial [Planctomycetales bacterium]|nr:ComEC/Rec2 family competence protein [Planctomycetales bacterium]